MRISKVGSRYDEQIKNLFNKGLEMNDIAKELGITKNEVKYRLFSLNLKRFVKPNQVKKNANRKNSVISWNPEDNVYAYILGYELTSEI